METLAAKQLLDSIGISSRVITVVLIVGAAFFIYKTVLDAELTKLQIKKVKKDLAV